MARAYTPALGKIVRKVAQARGGGTALPGLFVERLDPSFVRSTLAPLPYGVVVVSGTNGKTTTTKMVVELLRGQGLRVFTNPTGSNFNRGVAAALLGEVDLRGRLDADIAVVELDEAHAVHFVKDVPPTHCLLLNVMRDQLDRFGEIDTTARMLSAVAQATTTTVVLNRDDPRLGGPGFERGSATLATFGTSAELLERFPDDDNLRGGIRSADAAAAHSESDTSLESLREDGAVLSYAGRSHDVKLALHGVYNILNATAAVALTRAILGDKLDEQAMLTSLAAVTPAFGRGEAVMVNGQPCELVLVKNPAGFRLSLSSFSPDGYRTMIAINDDYADGRDLSWLWDVDFDSLEPGGVAMVSGVRAYDMALRLKYDQVAVEAVEPQLPVALDAFLRSGDGPKRIFCTYTAMLAIRKILVGTGALTEVR